MQKDSPALLTWHRIIRGNTAQPNRLISLLPLLPLFPTAITFKHGHGDREVRLQLHGDGQERQT